MLVFMGLSVILLGQTMSKLEAFARKNICPTRSIKVNHSESFHAQRGASLVEYALLVAHIAVVALASVRVLGRNVSQRFSTGAAQIGG